MTEDEFAKRIEKDVPIPPPSNTKWFWNRMKPGDSIVIDDRDRKSAYHCATRKGIKITMRPEPGKPGKTRVWLVG